jgi:hypothetical protein
VTGGTFIGHGAFRSFTAGSLVKNADDNWPTVRQAFPEVAVVHRQKNQDVSRMSKSG